jgi:hypothetical protein
MTHPYTYNVEVSWVSPTTGEPRRQIMTNEQAQEWWNMASYPVQCTASFRECDDGEG